MAMRGRSSMEFQFTGQHSATVAPLQESYNERQILLSPARWKKLVNRRATTMRMIGSGARGAAVLAVALLAASLQAQDAGVRKGISDKSAAYFNYAMGHLYADLGAAYGNR